MMVLQWIDAVAVVDRSLVQLPVLSARCPTGRDCKGSSQAYFPPPPFFFFLVVLCFDRPLLSSLCLLMSTVEPTAEGTRQPKRNKETTRRTTDCLQWAIGEGIGQYLCYTDTKGESQNGKLYCTLCAVWLSSKGAILKDHVLFCFVLTHDRLNMSNETLRHLAIMYANKMDKKRKCDEEE